MPGQLLVVAGPDQGRTFFVQDGQTVVIGRGANAETFQVGATGLRFQLVRGEEATTVVMSGSGPVPVVADLAEGRYRHLKCRQERGALVLALTAHQILDDELAEALRVEMLTAVGR